MAHDMIITTTRDPSASDRHQNVYQAVDSIDGGIAGLVCPATCFTFSLYHRPGSLRTDCLFNWITASQTKRIRNQSDSKELLVTETRARISIGQFPASGRWTSSDEKLVDYFFCLL